MSVQGSTRIGIALVALLAVAVIGLGIYAYGVKQRGGGPGLAGEGAVAVTVTSTACEPNTLTVPAGRVTFAVTNKSERVLEWEILDGVMVVEERENIAPGFVQTVSARLEPGVYAITCGLLSNPRGTLTVTAAANAPEGGKRPELVQFIGPMAEYKVYVSGEADALVAATGTLVAAVKAGDLASAQALYAPAHARYEHIKSAAQMFADLDAAIDARADYYAAREKDPAFGGFRRIAYGLYGEKSPAAIGPVADKLLADVGAMQARAKSAAIRPEKMTGGAASLIRAATVPEPGDAAALSDFAASVEGAGKIVALLRPLSQKADKALSDRIDAGLAALGQRLARYRTADGGPAADAKLTKEDGDALRTGAASLADDLGKLGGALGLE